MPFYPTHSIKTKSTPFKYFEKITKDKDNAGRQCNPWQNEISHDMYKEIWDPKRQYSIRVPVATN